MPKEKFLVTGCAGFIGGHMLDRLIRDGYETVGIDNFATGSPANMEAARGRFEFIEGSLCDARTAARAVRGVTRIIHLASVPSVPRSLENPLESAENSIITTVTLLNAAVKARVRRVVQASSSSVYGNPATSPNVETMTPNPLSPYATAKLTQEHYAKVFCQCYGLDTASLRYFNVFGPRQNPASKYSAVIPRFITMMMDGQHPVIFGDGEQRRDFTYVDNVVEANLRAALHHKPLCGETVNVGAGGGSSVNDLVRELNRLLGTGIEPIHQPGRLGEVRNSRAAIEKAGRLFGYDPAIDFAEGLRLTVEYFRGRQSMSA